MDKLGSNSMWSRRHTVVCLIAALLVWAMVQLAGCIIKTIRGFAMAEAGAQERIPDDDPAAPGPPFEPSFTELMNSMDGPVYVNRSTAVISLDIKPEDEGGVHENAGKLYPNFAKALESDQPILPSLDMIDVYTKQTDDRLVAAIEQHIHDGGSTFAGGKQGLLAAVLAEVLAAPQQPGQDEAASFLAAALLLSGSQPQAPAAILDEAKQEQTRFQDNPFNAKPIGLYTQSETLKRIFQRDRLLQQPFGSELFTGVSGAESYGAHNYPQRSLSAAIRIAEALDRRPDLLSAYTIYLQVAQRITNPDANLNLLEILQFKQHFNDETKLVEAIKQSPAWARLEHGASANPDKLGACIWPYATSKENQLFSRIYAMSNPAGDTMADLVRAIQDGNLSLAPQPDSGWYDYQVYALETLLLPDRAQEAAKLFLHSRYKLRLRRAFETMITQRRETQVKNLELGTAQCAAPELPMLSTNSALFVEPQPTNYLRTARGYRMLRQSLAGILGEEELAAAKLEGAQGPAAGMLKQAQATFTALYLLSCDDLGLKPELEPGEVAKLEFTAAVAGQQITPLQTVLIDNLPQLSPQDALQYAQACAFGKAWAGGLGATEYMQYDPRVIVPVLSSEDETYVHYWAVVGVQLAELNVEYAVPPRAVSAEGLDSIEHANAELAQDASGKDLPWEPGSWFLPVYVFREVRLKPDPLTREEFRAICDKGNTADEIVKLLEKKYGPSA